MLSILNRALSWAITSSGNKFNLKRRSRLIKALDNGFYVKFMQLEIGLFGYNYSILLIKSGIFHSIGSNRTVVLTGAKGSNRITLKRTVKAQQYVTGSALVCQGPSGEIPPVEPGN